MKPTYEAPHFQKEGASLVAFVRQEISFPWNWHYHPELELTWIREGYGRRLVGDHAAPYHAGEVVLLGPNLPHTWISDSKSPVNKAVVVQFHAFPRGLMACPEFSRIADLLNQATSGLRFLTSKPLEKLLKALPDKSGLTAWIGLMEILHHLATNEKAEVLSSGGYRHARSSKIVSRLERVIRHIDKHFREELPLAEVAQVAGLTPSSLSRLFHRMTNQTYVNYRNACRTREACRLLIETDRSITQVAGDCGFENLSNFNRRFQQSYQMTPTDFRRIHALSSF